MTDEQKAAYVHAQSVAAMAEIEGMKALNRQQELMGFTDALYLTAEFEAVTEKYELYPNQLIAFFKGE